MGAGWRAFPPGWSSNPRERERRKNPLLAQPKSRNRGLAEKRLDVQLACAAPRGESSAPRCGPESVDVPRRGTAVGREGRAFIGRQCGANRAARGGQEANGASRCCGCWCVVCCPGANQGREGAQQEAGQVDLEVQGRGALLGPNRTGTGDPATAAGRAACIKTRRCGVGVEGGNQKTEKEKRQKKGRAQQKTRDEREGNARVCARPGQGETEMLPGWVGVVSLQACRGVESDVQQQAKLELSPGWVY